MIDQIFSILKHPAYPLGNVYKKLWKITIEIVKFPMKNHDFP
jgi:hypothetical protein